MAVEGKAGTDNAAGFGGLPCNFPKPAPRGSLQQCMVAAKMAPAKQNGAPQPEVESPVVAVLQKRLRNLRKRVRNVEEIQAKADAGKELNADQVRHGMVLWGLGQAPGGTRTAVAQAQEHLSTADDAAASGEAACRSLADWQSLRWGSHCLIPCQTGCPRCRRWPWPARPACWPRSTSWRR